MSLDTAATLLQFSEQLVEFKEELLSQKRELLLLRLECTQAQSVRHATEQIQKQVESRNQTLDEKKVQLTNDLTELESEIDARRFDLQALNSELTAVKKEIVEAQTLKREVDSITVSSDITFVIFNTDHRELFSGCIIPVAVKLHFSDIFMNDLSLVSAGNQRIVSNYKSDEKSPYLIVRVEYKSDETTISTKIEDIKNDRSARFQLFDYNGKTYKCGKMKNQSQVIMNGPFLEYLYDPVKNLQNSASVQDAAT